MGHLALGTRARPACSPWPGRPRQQPHRAAGVGAGGRRRPRLSRSTRSARSARSTRRTGARLWASQTPNDRGNEASLYGGGIAYDNGYIYATNGLGYVAALDVRTGGIVWKVRPGGPLRGAPTVANGAIYVMSQDNQIYSLKEADGSTNWSQAAALEIAGVFGVGLARGRAGHGRRRLLVGRAQRLSLRERAAWCGRTRSSGPASAPACRRCRTSTPTR